MWILSIHSILYVLVRYAGGGIVGHPSGKSYIKGAARHTHTHTHTQTHTHTHTRVHASCHSGLHSDSVVEEEVGICFEDKSARWEPAAVVGIG